jgi:1-deoxy-D-xylulose-5-phosphate synthase
VRYPRGRDQSLYDTSDPVSTYVYRHIEGAKVLLVTYGRLANDLFTAIEILRNRDIKCDIIKLVNIFPIDNEVVDIMSAYDAVLFFEEAYYCGSISEKYASICPNVAQFAIDGFVKHGKCDVLLDELGFSAEKMADTVEGFLKDE